MHRELVPNDLAIRPAIRMLLPRDELVRARQWLPVALDQFRLVIPGIDVTQSPGTEDHQHSFCLGSEMRRARGERRFRADSRRPPRRLFRCEEPLVGEQRRQGDPRQAETSVSEEVAAVEQPATSVGQVVGRHRSLYGMKRNSLALNNARPSAGRPCFRTN